jgi:hypothetical protein
MRTAMMRSDEMNTKMQGQRGAHTHISLHTNTHCYKRYTDICTHMQPSPHKQTASKEKGIEAD